ncbi:MAG: hypothetical protein ACRC41_11575, partial [Sarcina sp.]
MAKKMETILALGAAAVIAGSATLPQAAQAQEVTGNHDIKNKNNLELDSANNLSISVSGVTVTKAGGISPNANATYVPQTTVLPTGNQVTDGSVVTYNINVALNATNGKTFNVGNCTVTADPTVTYGSNPTPQDIKIANEIASQLQVQLQNAKNLNSTSTFNVQASIGIQGIDWNTTINPNIKIHIDGQTIPVNVQPLQGTTKYSEGIMTNPSTDGNNIIPGWNITKYNPYSQNRYNACTKTINSVTLQVSNSDSNAEAIPMYPNDMKETSNGTYVLTGQALSDLESGKAVFKMKPKNPNEKSIDTVTVTPTAISVDGINQTDLNAVNAIFYNGATTNWTYFPQGHLGKQIVQFEQSVKLNDSGHSSLNANWSSNVAAGLAGEWRVYSGLFLQDGSAVLYKNGNFVGNQKDKYISLSGLALQTLENGSPEAKLNLMRNIIEGRPVDGAIVVSGSALKNGTSCPSPINLVIAPTSNSATAQNGTSANNTVGVIPYNAPKYDSVITDSVVVAKALTVGVNLYPDTNSANFDGLIKGIDGFDSDGFIIGNNNQVTPTNVINNDAPNFTGIESAPVIDRTGEASVDESSNYIQGYSAKYPTVDGGSGSLSKQASWLNTSHIIPISTYAPSPVPGVDATYSKGTTLTIDLGAPFEIGSQGVSIGSVKIPAKDYKIEGNNLIITNVPTNIPASSMINTDVQYTDPATSNITITATSSNTDTSNPTGIVYDINNNSVPLTKIYPGGSVSTSQTIIVNHKFVSACVHLGTAVNADNESTLTDQITNGAKQDIKYLIIGQLPTANRKSLPGNSGQPSDGGLGATLESFTKNPPQWVLPKSSLNNPINQKIVLSTNENSLAKASSEIANPMNGWVRYKPGMDLSNYVAYAGVVNIKAGSIYDMSYKVKLKGIQSGTFQYTTSQFKYYDMNNKVGSLSNVINLAPGNVNLNNYWDANVVLMNKDGSTQEIPKVDLDKTIKVGGKQYSLAYLVAHGQDADGQWDNIPDTSTDHLEQSATQAFNNEVMQALGYKLVKATVQVGQAKPSEKDLNWFTTTGSINGNTEFTKVIFYLEKVTPKQVDTVTVKTADGKYVKVDGSLVTKDITQQNVNGQEGTETKLNKPVVPKGYYISKITVNGKEISDINGYTLPKDFTNTNTNIVYTVTKDPTVTVIVNGGEKPGTSTYTGTPGSKISIPAVKVGKGEHI